MGTYILRLLRREVETIFVLGKVFFEMEAFSIVFILMAVEKISVIKSTRIAVKYRLMDGQPVQIRYDNAVNAITATYATNCMKADMALFAEKAEKALNAKHAGRGMMVSEAIFSNLAGVATYAEKAKFSQASKNENYQEMLSATTKADWCTKESEDPAKRMSEYFFPMKEDRQKPCGEGENKNGQSCLNGENVGTAIHAVNAVNCHIALFATEATIASNAASAGMAQNAKEADFAEFSETADKARVAEYATSAHKTMC